MLSLTLRIDEPVSSGEKEGETQAVTHYNCCRRETPLPTAVGDPGDHVFAHKVESYRVAFSESHLVGAAGIVRERYERCIIESRLE